MPAKAGIQGLSVPSLALDARFRGHDDKRMGKGEGVSAGPLSSPAQQLQQHDGLVLLRVAGAVEEGHLLAAAELA